MPNLNFKNIFLVVFVVILLATLPDHDSEGKYECLNHLILSSVEQLEYVLKQYCQYYHHERIHQSLGRIIEPKHVLDDRADIQCIERLGGLLKSYHRIAA